MVQYKDAKNFFPYPDDSSRGEYIVRVVDPKQSYYSAKPVNAEDDASNEPDFQKKD